MLGALRKGPTGLNFEQGMRFIEDQGWLAGGIVVHIVMYLGGLVKDHSGLEARYRLRYSVATLAVTGLQLVAALVGTGKSLRSFCIPFGRSSLPCCSTTGRRGLAQRVPTYSRTALLPRLARCRPPHWPGLLSSRLYRLNDLLRNRPLAHLYADPPSLLV